MSRWCESDEERTLCGDTSSPGSQSSTAGSETSYRSFGSTPSKKSVCPQPVQRQHIVPKFRKFIDLNEFDLYLPPDFLNPDPSVVHASANLIPKVWSPRGSLDGQRESHADKITNASKPRITEDWIMFQSRTRSLRSCLGQGRVDPFTRFPIKMGHGENWLIDQVYLGQDPSFQNLRERWLPLAINDSAAFHQFIANAAINVFRMQGNNVDQLMSVAHHSLAVRSINRQLMDQKQCSSDNVIQCVVEFVSYTVCRDDFTTLKIHLDGLERLVKMKGGIDGIRNLMLARMVYGVDVSAASRQDVQPRFALPTELLNILKNLTMEEVDFHRRANQISTPSWRGLFPSDHPFNNIFKEIMSAKVHIQFKVVKRQRWRDVDFVLYWIGPIMHKLMSMERLTAPVGMRDIPSLWHEIVRLGICIFLGPVRRNSGKIGVSTKTFVVKLEALLCEVTSEEMIFLLQVSPILLLWVVFFGMLESWNLPQEAKFIELTILAADECRLKDWDDIVSAVSNFLWMMDELFAIELARTRQKFMKAHQAVYIREAFPQFQLHRGLGFHWMVG